MQWMISNGTIVDGSKKQAYVGDIIIEDSVIKEIGELSNKKEEMKYILDAKGQVVAPGFIDTHSHSDLKILSDRDIRPKIYQGITTEVLGQDGISMAPLPKKYIKDWRKNLSGLEGDSDDISWNYETVTDYFHEIETKGLTSNICYLVPHGNIRMEAMGLSADKAGKEELENMKRILRRELEAGAAGLSSGLIYIPCAYGDTEELIELCKVVAEYNKIFVVHQRSEANEIIDSMKEIIRIGRESKVKIHFSHFKICGKNNWDKAEEIISLMEEAEKDGVKISFDQYPYEAGSTMLSVIIPPWVHSGGTNKMLERIKSEELRPKIIEEIYETNCNWDNFVEFAGIDGIYITSVKTDKNKNVIGKNLKELGEMRGKDPVEATLDLLIEEENAVGMIDYYGSEELVIKFMKRKEQNFCTDGLLGGKPHPRVYGAFPRGLGRYVRELKALSLEEAVYKMTYKAAETIGIKDRGYISPGFKADIVIFNKDEIIDKGTFIEPEQYPEGISYVIVNGNIVIKNGEYSQGNYGTLIKQINEN
ncbi:N-acyl-D-amino-acid deacylase [Clostridium sp. DL-VIII]|uniref:N-acyl-D-amino-acid deacylase family protein n=1 Tax=Clostridium sp. DL-VIII TaxID=641107 RepID=UPI00023AF2BD|nr:D-aminoacylase [Clostridium sp. DL-VIII]EHI97694.1 N-acyl-D-amino-acid deacylase [Clostridium sp. DL-VIII]